MRARRDGLICVVLCAVLASASTTAAETCAPGEALYMALEPVKEPLGVRGETRQQFLDRVYPGWREDKNETIRVAASSGGEPETIRVSVTPSAEAALEHVVLIAESRLEYIDANGSRGERFGHREIGRYPLEADVSAEIAVPRSAFRESGSLVVAVSVRRTDPAGARGVVVRALPVTMEQCPRRVYTHDRFTAIRLNRARQK